MPRLPIVVATVLVMLFSPSEGATLGPCEFVCPLSLVKVCGSDGQTYDSECDLRKSACLRRSFNKLTVAHQGSCEEAVLYADSKPCEFVCPLSLTPVCGSDGQTYDTECDLKKSACLKNVNSIKLASADSPYSTNEPFRLRRSFNKLTVAHQGSCEEAVLYADSKPCEFVCPLSLTPVCGSDGQTYDTECDLRKSACLRRSFNKLTVAHQGSCEEAVLYADSKPCEFVCPLSLTPVCGSDGQTYDTECDLRKSACLRRSMNKLTVAHEGPCNEAKPCEFVCPLSLVPVCGSDGQTYDSECDLRRSACVRRSLTKLTVAYEGACETAVQLPLDAETAGPCEFVCHFSLVPVCGSDGHTYLNECDLKQISCKIRVLLKDPSYSVDCCKTDTFGNNYEDKRRRSLNKLVVAHTGACECDLVFCRYSEIPVCGTDGNLYDNECHLKKSACRNGADISVKNQGPCTN